MTTRTTSSAFLLILAACNGASDVGITTYEEPPAVSLTAPTNGAEFDEGEVITFSAIIADEKDPATELTLIWRSDVDGELNAAGTADAEGQVSFATANLSPGFTHTVSLEVIDSDALSTTATVAVNVIELPDVPNITVVQPASGQSGIEGQAFEFIVQVSDSKDAPEDLSVIMESDLEDPGRFCAATPDVTGKATCEYTLVPGVHGLEFIVEDLDGFSASSTVYFTVVAATEIDDDGDGWTETQGDCDDTDPSINPAEEEVENGVDDNCDGEIDEGTAAYDDDGDGYSENEGDCDDADEDISPAATEICGNSTDENCDSSLEDEDAIDCEDYYYDYDGDGYGTTSSKCLCSADGYYSADNPNDCYDYNSSANPAQTGYFSITRGDGKYDYNCDSSEDREDTKSGKCSGAVWVCTTSNVGWSGSVPGCGVTKDYVTSCDATFLSCDEKTTSKTQACR